MDRSPSAKTDLAARLIVGLAGPWPTDEEWNWLKQWSPAGVILFSRNVESFSQLKNLCSALKQWVPGLHVMADHEGGPVSQLAAAVGRPPVAWSLGVLDDVELTRLVHEETGRRLKAAGLDRVLGPCADVMSEPRNPVVGARAFGAHSDLVSRHVEAAVQGLSNAGLSCCLKHWPGHGGSGTDSHLETTVVQISPEDEEPFRHGLQAGAESVMVGHLLFDDSGLPATLSPTFLQKTRSILGADCSAGSEFVLLADDVSMGGLRQPMAQLGVSLEDGLADFEAGAMVEVEALTVAWFEHLTAAGCDQLLLRGIPFSAFPTEILPDSAKVKYPVRAQNVLGEEVARCDDFADEAYLETRQRCHSDFSDSRGYLVYLDLAQQDRWQVAGGLGAEHWTQWDTMLAANFAKVWRSEQLDQFVSDGAPVSNLLVTNHRPMLLHWDTTVWAQSLQMRLASSGRCLVMGHPSLAGDFEVFLGENWVVESLYDVSCEDFNPVKN